MSVKEGMGWPHKGEPLKEAIKEAAQYFKAKWGRYPNFIRLAPSVAEELGDHLNGLLVIADPAVGKSYRFLIGYSAEAKKQEVRK